VGEVGCPDLAAQTDLWESGALSDGAGACVESDYMEVKLASLCWHERVKRVHRGPRACRQSNVPQCASVTVSVDGIILVAH
jgi:hypothetical protein